MDKREGEEGKWKCNRERERNRERETLTWENQADCRLDPSDTEIWERGQSSKRRISFWLRLCLFTVCCTVTRSTFCCWLLSLLLCGNQGGTIFDFGQNLACWYFPTHSGRLLIYVHILFFRYYRKHQISLFKGLKCNFVKIYFVDYHNGTSSLSRELALVHNNR